MKRTVLALIVSFLVTRASAQGQEGQPGPPESGVPIVTGYTGFINTFESNDTQHLLGPSITPIVLIPFGKRWLIEAEGEFEGEYMHRPGEPWEREWEKGVEYLQVDFIANKYVTVVAGRFLTPFGIFNERFHPLWIKNLQTTPLIFPLGTGSSNGAMLRGGIRVGSGVNLNYAAYYSAASTVSALEARRAAGSRVSLFFPGQRLELGTSFQRQLQDERFNSYGFDLTWQVKPIPLDVRGEYAKNKEQGSGYWLEGAYRLRQVPFARKFFRKSQAVLRFDQFFKAPPHEEEGMESEEEGGHGGAVPAVNTQRVTFGWNYYFNDGLRLSAAYGRAFSSEGDRNVWTIGIAYRWTFPLGGKRQ